MISSSSAKHIRLARKRLVEINRRTSSTVESKRSTPLNTKSPGDLYRVHFGGFNVNEAREENKDLLAYLF